MATPVALYLQDAHPLREAMGYVQYAEQRGFDAVWQAESRLVREANGGDGWHAHPTQALLDLYTMREHLPGGSLAGRKVVILGDLLHSRVARSNIWTLTAAGADLWLCGPATLLRGFEAWAGRGAAAGRRFHVTPRSTRRCATPTSSWRSGSSASGWPPGCCPRCANTPPDMG